MITRFAPSPTGELHLGHALAAWIAYDEAQRHGGSMLLRFEDIDTTRVREEFYAAIEHDLRWLGISWQGTPWRQRDRGKVYDAALARLRDMGVIYPCFCTRKEIAMMAQAPQQGDGQEGLLYPGTCRHMPEKEREQRMAQAGSWAWRLDATRAAEVCGALTWHDRARGQVDVDATLLGDVVIARKDIGVSYHLAVVVDDAAQEVSLVTRGADLFASTHVHVLLQKMLHLPQPQYWHHPLVCDEQGKRLAKRDQSMSLSHLRAQGLTPAQVKEKAKEAMRNMEF
jgi:glutamyl-Q tRNA(Asp) synthetase